MVRAGSFGRVLEVVASWMLALLWIAPLVYAVWAAVHPSAYATRFDLIGAVDDGELGDGVGGGAVSAVSAQYVPDW